MTGSDTAVVVTTTGLAFAVQQSGKGLALVQLRVDDL
jgi:hypothetical protein